MHKIATQYIPKSLAEVPKLVDCKKIDIILRRDG